MILLNSTDSLQVLLAGAITTSQCVLYAAYADVATDGSTFAPGSANGLTNSTTAVSWMSAPASSNVRQTKYLSLYNADTVSVTATVRINDGTNTRILLKATLATGERLEYTVDGGFRTVSASGSTAAVTSVNGATGAIVGVTAGKHAVPIMAGSIQPSASGGCAALATIASAANQPDIVSLDFDTTTQEFAQFAIPMPKSWNEGTITAAFRWSHAATTTNFGVVWSLQAVAVSDDDTIAVAYGTAQQIADTGGTTNDLYITSETSAITIAGTPAAGDTVYFRVARVPADGSDTMAIDARLHSVIVYMTTDADNDA